MLSELGNSRTWDVIEISPGVVLVSANPGSGGLAYIVRYNFDTTTFPADEAPGVSVFFKDDSGALFHTYSTYSRGLDGLNGAYHYMDLAPKGRDEGQLSYTMAWLRRHDQYDD